MERRMKKVELALQELRPPELEGPADAPVTLIGWGSSKGVIGEARALLAAEGVRANQLHIKYLHPFHTREVKAILGRSKMLIGIEGNYTGQFARFLRVETGRVARSRATSRSVSRRERCTPGSRPLPPRPGRKGYWSTR